MIRTRFNNRRRSSSDSNNNSPSEIDGEPIRIELSDGIEIGKNEIVWIKHNLCLDTLVIVQDILDGGRVEVRNLIDNNVIIIGSEHLTLHTEIQLDSEIYSGNRTLALIKERNCRKAIEKLTRSINAVERLKFCSDGLKKILADIRDGDFSKLESQLTRCHLKTDKQQFKLNVYDLRHKMKLAPATISNEEAQSIAEKILQDKRGIPFELPRWQNSERNIILTCSVCLRQNNKMELKRCTKCASIFHESCHRNETECRQCLAGNTPTDIVYAKAAKVGKAIKWWPAIVIPNNQVPDMYRKNPIQPGFVFVYVIGSVKSTYEQVHASNLLTFRIDDALRNAILKRVDATLNAALRIAAALDDGLA
ncbi:uncharacterized protein LOC129565013 [Sitodiplosis mosellana]|uniref:uncharacterized protein LOC129565013 n=1 Tax=Sitodiplosis mosellana TaxID=263140 RepID=UPI0024446BFE|nr:uncharacterized protein LOC129565013 [Sitodiplosis mosellana]